jgi:sterol desaturase/sphingolipid hydroxylase (fatty acid hydroxylase superfamily)
MQDKAEIWIRLGAFFSVLLIMNLWEWLSPRREWRVPKARRLLSNYLLVVVNTVLLRFLLPVTAVAVAIWSAQHSMGLFNRVSLPLFVEIPLGVILLDLAIYGQHVAFHFVPVFWQFHKVHHADLDLDVSSGLRFHTIEIFLSMGIKMAFVLLLGIHWIAVMAFEVLLNATSMFNHSNVNLPPVCDRLLRLLVVTPDMHRVHHSVIRKETDSNFGFNLSCWDRLFRTYRDQPEKGHLEMDIGLPEYRSDAISDRLWPMLMIPFRKTSRKPEASGQDEIG